MELYNVFHGVNNINIKQQLENVKNVILCAQHAKLQVQIIVGAVGKDIQRFQWIQQLLVNAMNVAMMVTLEVVMLTVSLVIVVAKIVKDLQQQIACHAMPL